MVQLMSLTCEICLHVIHAAMCTAFLPVVTWQRITQTLLVGLSIEFAAILVPHQLLRYPHNVQPCIRHASYIHPRSTAVQTVSFVRTLLRTLGQNTQIRNVRDIILVTGNHKPEFGKASGNPWSDRKTTIIVGNTRKIEGGQQPETIGQKVTAIIGQVGPSMTKWKYQRDILYATAMVL